MSVKHTLWDLSTAGPFGKGDIMRASRSAIEGGATPEQLGYMVASFEQREEILASIKRQMGSKTYLEIYLNFASADRARQLRSAQTGEWTLSQEMVPPSHDAMMARRAKLVPEAHPFFISAKMIDDEVPSWDEANEKRFMLDTPFPTVWVERTDGGPLFYMPATKGPGWIMGMLVHEEGPHGYLFEAVVAQSDLYAGKLTTKLFTGMLEPATVFGRLGSYKDAFPQFRPGTMIQTAAHDVLSWVFAKFKRECAFANERIIPLRARVGTGKGREPVKVSRIVRVMLKGERKAYERAASRPVEWSHQWEVMGHWRHVDGIGKDREGRYCVRGQTWVKPYVKGKGELVIKERVVVDGKEDENSMSTHAWLTTVRRDGKLVVERIDVRTIEMVKPVHRDPFEIRTVLGIRGRDLPVYTIHPEAHVFALIAAAHREAAPQPRVLRSTYTPGVRREDGGYRPAVLTSDGRTLTSDTLMATEDEALAAAREYAWSLAVAAAAEATVQAPLISPGESGD